MLWSEVEHQIATKVDWSLVFYCVFFLVIIGIVVKLFDVSPTEMFRDLVREFVGLRNGTLDRGSLNALGIVLIFIFESLYLILDRFRTLAEFIGKAQGEHHGSPYEFLIALALLGVFALLSVLSVPRPGQ